MRRTLCAAVSAAGLIVALGACSSSSGSGSGKSAAAQAPAAAQPVPGTEQNAAGAADKAGGGTATDSQAHAPAELPLQVPVDRAIIYNGTMTVRVSDVDAAAARLAGFATGNGGYVSSDQRSSGDDPAASTATVTLRIPADRFYATVNQIGTGLGGTEESRQISAEDVTAKLVDLTSRVKTQQASVDRIRALMGKANSITDVTALESELSRREADLESLQAQQRELANLSTLSTITVTLLHTGAPAAKPKPRTGFVAGLAAGWQAFTRSVRGVLTVLGAVLPFAVAVGVPVWLVLWLLRRRRTVTRPAPVIPPPASENG